MRGMIIFQPWEPKLLIYNEASHTKDKILSCSPGISPSAQGLFRAAKPPKLWARLVCIQRGGGLLRSPTTPKGWSWSPKAIPAQVIHKHFLEIQFSLFLWMQWAS